MTRPVALLCCVASRCCISSAGHLLAFFRSAPAACLTNGLGRTRRPALNPRRHHSPRAARIGGSDLRNRCRPALHRLHVDHHGRRIGVAEFLPPPLSASRLAGHINLVALDAMGCRQPRRDLLTIERHDDHWQRRQPIPPERVPVFGIVARIAPPQARVPAD